MFISSITILFSSCLNLILQKLSHILFLILYLNPISGFNLMYNPVPLANCSLTLSLIFIINGMLLKKFNLGSKMLFLDLVYLNHYSH